MRRRSDEAAMNSKSLRSLALQALLLAAVAALFAAAFANARANLSARGIPTSLDFLGHVAGFRLNQSFIAYSPLSSYARALLVGLVNTIVVSALAGGFATLIGFAAGFARLSRNWALARLAGLYVETVRNIPLLLQMLFWYVAILSPLPGPADSLKLPGVILNNRGFYLPAPVFSGEALWVGLAVLVAAVLAWMWRLAPSPLSPSLDGRPYGRPMGRRGALPRWWPLILVILPLAVFFALGRPLSLELPGFDAQKNPFNVEGGVRLPPEIVALVLALSLYTGSYIAEIVRAGVNSVARGQSEAAAALGLDPAQARRLVIRPQAMRIILPPLISQYLGLTKNSSLAAFVGFADLMQVSGTILNQTGAAVQVIALDMAIYLSLSMATLLALRFYERRLAWGAQR
jgi:general L-amino acid transport system permease protein